MNRPSAGAHIAIGARKAHAGELTVHPNVTVTIAIAVVVPIAIAPKTSTGRHGIVTRRVMAGLASPGSEFMPNAQCPKPKA